jgi:xylulokinase
VSHDPLFVGLDCSTHGVKAIAWSARGEPAAQAAAAFPLNNPQPGFWEQDPQQWLDASIHVLARLAREAGPRIASLAITHQRETFVGVDATGAPVRPAIVWMDERARLDVEHLRAAVGAEAFHSITGKPLNLTPSISKIHWIRRVEPDAFRRVDRWLDVQAWLVRHLTGEDATSVGSADPTGLVNLSRGQWDDALLEAVGILPRQLPRLVPSGSVVGSLAVHQALATGLPSGLPIVATAGDGQVAALGAGVRDLRAAYMNLGTAIVAGVVAGELLVDRAFRTMSGAEPKTFLLESDLKGGTFTVDWLVERLLGSTRNVAELEVQACAVPAGAGGLVLVPYLATVMDPYWDDDASGLLLGLRGDHGPAHVFRAILEGIAFEERLHLEGIERATGETIEKVHVLGGGASSALWCQILADVLDRPVVRTRHPEATSLGAAMLGAVAIGSLGSAAQAVQAMGGTGAVFEPGEDRARYARLYAEVFVGLYPAARGAMSKLARILREPRSGPFLSSATVPSPEHR